MIEILFLYYLFEFACLPSCTWDGSLSVDCFERWNGRSVSHWDLILIGSQLMSDESAEYVHLGHPV